MTELLVALASLLGLATTRPADIYPDTGTLDIFGTSGWCVSAGENVRAVYDFDTNELLGADGIERVQGESREALFRRFEKRVAEFEKNLGITFERGVYKPWTDGKFPWDHATFKGRGGEMYVNCHYLEMLGMGQVQWGVRKEPKTEARPDPFGAAYRALWSDALNAEIDARIEKYRKADGVFPLQGPAAGARVTVEQVSSEFQIGCNIFNFDQLGDARQNAEYRAAFMEGGLFNAATVPFYWKNLEPEKGKARYCAGPEENPDYWKVPDKTDNAWRRPAIEPVLDFCEANGVSVHGHVLIYPAHHPKWVNVDDLGARMKLYEDHIAEIAARYRDRIPQWDIVNESVDRASTSKAPHDRLPWCKIPQPPDYTFACFKAAARSFPQDVKLCINDAYTGPSDDGRYPAFTRQLLGRGAKIDVIGSQMHIFSDQAAVEVASGATTFPNCISWKPADQIAVLRQYDRLEKPVHISEVTIPAPVSLLPRDEAEALQARLLRDNYRLWFSWPSVYRISYWNMVDSVGGEILESGFFRRDMSKKPVYETLHRLVHEEWRTRTEATADAQGVVRFRGFKGKYRLSWTDGKGVRRVQFVTLADREEKFVTPAAEPPRPGAVAVFRKRLPKSRKRIARVELRLVPLGVFALRVDGENISTGDFMPGGYTHPVREKHRFTYDLTSVVRRGGANDFEIDVAGSWWCDKVARRNNSPGTVPALGGEIVYTFDDGTLVRAPIDRTWQGGWSRRHTFATVYDGEDYDAGGGEPDFGPVKETAEFVGNVVPRRGGVSVLRTDLARKPVGLQFPVLLKAGETLTLDFGQNHAGVPEFAWCAKKGVKVTVRTAEMLNDEGGAARGNDGPAGTLYRKNLRSARSEMRYTFGDEPADRASAYYRPTFSYFGYRYASVVADGDLVLRGVRSLPATNVEEGDETGAVETGDARLNRFVQNCRWSMLSNFLSIPTDCPQRDERIGWAADTQVFAPAALYLADLQPLLSKYCRDLSLSQMSKGAFPPIAPYWNFEDGALDHFGAAEGWADAGVQIPHALWLFKGDRRTPAENWAAMERYMELLAQNRGHDWHRYGDWLSFDSNEEDVRRYISLCYWARDARAMKEMALDLGKPDRAEFYAMTEREVQDVLRATTAPDVPSCAAHAVFAGLTVPKEKIVPPTGRLTTGFLGAACILDSLSAMGGTKEAYDLLLQRECPGWLYTVDQGGTTVWERWNSYTKADGFGDAAMNSFNHYAYGAVLRWIFSTAAGIVPDPKNPGFRHFHLRPQPDARLGHLTSVYRSGYGLIVSAWKYEGDKCAYQFEIPPNTTATLVLPDGRTDELGPGTHWR